MKKELAILIPAFNEEKVIQNCIDSALQVNEASDIYVVDDHSSDSTSVIAKSNHVNVLSLPQNQGKAYALNQAISYFDLMNKYDFIFPFDADSIVDKSFWITIKSHFENKKVVAVAGRVRSSNTSWIAAYRVWEYQIAQSIYKKAQGILNTIFVCPGVSTVFRSELFNAISFQTDTHAEDMDITYQIHRKKLGIISYSEKSYVTTQDPSNVKDYIKQIHRWYTGFWQCLHKYQVPNGRQLLDLEISLLAAEALFNGFFALLFTFLGPVLFVNNPYFFFTVLTIDLFFFVIPTASWAAFVQRDFSILKYLPHFFLLRTMSNLVFIYSFIDVTLGFDIKLKWHKPKRYKIELNEYGT